MPTHHPHPITGIEFSTRITAIPAHEGFLLVIGGCAA